MTTEETMMTEPMQKEEAIETLKSLVFGTFDRTTAKEREALDMAIKALDSWDKYSSELWKNAYDRGFKDGVSEGIKAME